MLKLPREPEINLVAVILEDLLFGKLLLELDGDEHLGQFAASSAFRGRAEELARQLHG